MFERMCSISVLKYVGLAVGLAAKFTTGSIFIFNAYQDAIKHTFNYTQLEGKQVNHVYEDTHTRYKHKCLITFRLCSN